MGLRRGQWRLPIEAIHPNEEGVIACTVRPYEGIAFTSSKKFKGTQRAAPVKMRIMRAGATKHGIIRHCDRMLRSEHAVVFHDYNDRSYALHSLPHPIIVSVYIDAQKTDLARESSFFDQPIDVVPVDERAFGREIVSPVCWR